MVIVVNHIAIIRYETYTVAVLPYNKHSNFVYVCMGTIYCNSDNSKMVHPLTALLEICIQIFTYR